MSVSVSVSVRACVCVSALGACLGAGISPRSLSSLSEFWSILTRVKPGSRRRRTRRWSWVTLSEDRTKDPRLSTDHLKAMTHLVNLS